MKRKQRLRNQHCRCYLQSLLLVTEKWSRTDVAEFITKFANHQLWCVFFCSPFSLTIALVWRLLAVMSFTTVLCHWDAVKFNHEAYLRSTRPEKKFQRPCRGCPIQCFTVPVLDVK